MSELGQLRIRRRRRPRSPAADNGSDCPTCRGNHGRCIAALVSSTQSAASHRGFPLLSVEKEFAQATGRAATNGLTDRQALHQVLSRPENRYLVRQLCWVMTIEGLETYILVPHDPADTDLLVESLRATPLATDVDVVIGTKGPIAPPSLCNGLLVPIVSFDQIYSFDVDALLDSIPRPETIGAEQFKAVTQEVFSRVTQMADNAGDMDEHRAINYLAMRYPSIYSAVADAHAGNASLTRGRCAAVGVERNPADRRGGLLIHQPSDRCGGEALHAGRCDRTVPVLGYQDVALLRPLILPT